MKNFRKKQMMGFSLAEALITLLIVCLITMASIPVLTKKRRDISKSEHGQWMCTLKDNDPNQHVYWSKEAGNGDPNNPSTWTVSGSSCKFVPPPNARNFAITAVAGGGGGAGAQAQTKSWTEDFAVEYYGYYKMIAIGGGGGAGKTKCYKRAGGGGAGGIAYTYFKLDDKVSQIKMIKGKGITPKSDKYNPGDAGDSAIVAVVRQPSGSTTTKDIVRAQGGISGEGRWGLDGACKHGSGAAGKNGGSSSQLGAKIELVSLLAPVASCSGSICFGRIGYNTAENINKFFYPYVIYAHPDDLLIQYGRGGQPNGTSGSDIYSRNGNDGYVFVSTEIYGSGGGGKSGQSRTNAFYPKLLAKSLEITIGAGGKGGEGSSTKDATNGLKGGDTSVGDLFGLRGGNGGSTKYSTQTLSSTPGENGEESPLYYKVRPPFPYGGATEYNTSENGITSANGYGAGGGGGGVQPYNSDSNSRPKAGNGANGSPGIVIIEW